MSRIFQFLRVKSVNDLVFRVRLFYFLHLRKRFEIASDLASVIDVKYSKEMLKKGKTSHRPLKLIAPLVAIDMVNESTKILSVGPRFETELLYLLAYGFKKSNIEAIDSVSYSPWVRVGNMHALPYPNDCWDIVLLGWILTYSDDPYLAAREAIRVLKPGGLIVVGVAAYSAEELADMEKSGSYIGDIRSRRQSSGEILKLFGDSVDTVYFRHDPIDETVSGSAIVLFSRK